MGAIIKASSSKSSGGTKGLEEYLKQEHKTEELLMYGKDCNVDYFAKDFQDTRELYKKTDGRQHLHFIQSWEEGEVTPEQANEIGQKWLEHEKFKGYQAVCITHYDKKNIHNHIVINSVNLENGLKYRHSKFELEKLKEFSNEINLERGIEPQEKTREKGKLTTYDKDKYQIIKKALQGKAKSYVLDTAMAVEKSIKNSIDKQAFIDKMKNLGYETSWTDEKKHVTFKNLESGKKVRLSNIGKTFSDEEKYSKEGFNKEFEKFKEKIPTGKEINNNSDRVFIYKNFKELTSHSKVRPEINNYNLLSLEGADPNVLLNYLKNNGNIKHVTFAFENTKESEKDSLKIREELIKRYPQIERTRHLPVDNWEEELRRKREKNLEKLRSGDILKKYYVRKENEKIEIRYFVKLNKVFVGYNKDSLEFEKFKTISEALKFSNENGYEIEKIEYIGLDDDGKKYNELLKTENLNDETREKLKREVMEEVNKINKQKELDRSRGRGR